MSEEFLLDQGRGEDGSLSSISTSASAKRRQHQERIQKVLAAGGGPRLPPAPHKLMCAALEDEDEQEYDIDDARSSTSSLASLLMQDIEEARAGPTRSDERVEDHESGSASQVAGTLQHPLTPLHLLVPLSGKSIVSFLFHVI